jgi:hypothetical protein
LLSVRFVSAERAPVFVSASAMPSLKDAAIAQAVCDYLLARPAASEPI